MYSKISKTLFVILFFLSNKGLISVISKHLVLFQSNNSFNIILHSSISKPFLIGVPVPELTFSESRLSTSNDIYI